MPTIFTRIIDGELPGHFVWKDDRTVAFLSINPLKPGHTLVVPRREIDHWIDLDDELRSACMDTAHAVGRALHTVYHPEKVGLMLAGLEVPHAHVHLVPIWGVHDLDFANAAARVDPEVLAGEAERIRAGLRELGYDPGVL
jgi:diadenosine tetraphosphate (Ap4A) HIT family hydrolase